MSDPNFPSWNDLAGIAKPAGMSQEMAAKLLELNPALGKLGLTVDAIVEERHKQVQKPASAPVSGGFLELVVHQANELAAEQKRIDAEMKALEAKRKELQARAADGVQTWLLKNDPDLLSPMTQAVFAQKKDLLERIGFSITKFIETRMTPAARSPK